MAQKDLLAVAKRIRIRAKYVTKNSDNLVKAVAYSVVETLVTATPVRTSRARANWRILFFKPLDVLFPAPQKPPHPGYGLERALDEARTTIAEYKGRRSIWITNNVPYIKKLNAGSSSQAPAGFIEMAVQAGRLKVQTARPVSSEVIL